jgi:hypothetical protein
VPNIEKIWMISSSEIPSDNSRTIAVVEDGRVRVSPNGIFATEELDNSDSKLTQPLSLQNWPNLRESIHQF